MKENTIKKILIVLILLVGNSVFMMLVGPVRLSENTLNVIANAFGINLFSDFIEKVGEGIFIIISYAIILWITIKIFSENKKDREK